MLKCTSLWRVRILVLALGACSLACLAKAEGEPDAASGLGAASSCPSVGGSRGAYGIVGYILGFLQLIVGLATLALVSHLAKQLTNWPDNPMGDVTTTACSSLWAWAMQPGNQVGSSSQRKALPSSGQRPFHGTAAAARSRGPGTSTHVSTQTDNGRSRSSSLVGSFGTSLANSRLLPRRSRSRPGAITGSVRDAGDDAYSCKDSRGEYRRGQSWDISWATSKEGLNCKPSYSDLPGNEGRIQVLSVDDEPVNHTVMHALLHASQYDVVTLDSGEALLEYIEEEEVLPDVVLLDVTLPGISGFQATCKLREDFGPALLPIIMVTCSSKEADIIEGLGAGANDYMTKPLRYAELKARISTQVALRKNMRLATEASRNFNLLQSILPSYVITQLKRGVQLVAHYHDSVTILFSDIKGFTNMAAEWPTEQIILMLNDMFVAFDNLCEDLGVYKVETIGDAYMIVSGHDGVKDHASRMMAMASAMIHTVSQMRGYDGKPIEIRVGVHTGPAHSGVVGVIRPRYCFFGDTVNTASRMESTSFPSCAQVSEATYLEVTKWQQERPTHTLSKVGFSIPRRDDDDESDTDRRDEEEEGYPGTLRLRDEQLYEFMPCGERSVKGKGIMRTYLLKIGAWELAQRTLFDRDTPPGVGTNDSASEPRLELRLHGCGSNGDMPDDLRGGGSNGSLRKLGSREEPANRQASWFMADLLGSACCSGMIEETEEEEAGDEHRAAGVVVDSPGVAGIARRLPRLPTDVLNSPVVAKLPTEEAGGRRPPVVKLGDRGSAEKIVRLGTPVGDWGISVCREMLLGSQLSRASSSMDVPREPFLLGSEGGPGGSPHAHTGPLPKIGSALAKSSALYSSPNSLLPPSGRYSSLASGQTASESGVPPSAVRINAEHCLRQSLDQANGYRPHMDSHRFSVDSRSRLFPLQPAGGWSPSSRSPHGSQSGVAPTSSPHHASRSKSQAMESVAEDWSRASGGGTRSWTSTKQTNDLTEDGLPQRLEAQLLDLCNRLAEPTVHDPSLSHARPMRSHRASMSQERPRHLAIGTPDKRTADGPSPEKRATDRT